MCKLASYTLLDKSQPNCCVSSDLSVKKIQTVTSICTRNKGLNLYVVSTYMLDLLIAFIIAFWPGICWQTRRLLNNIYNDSPSTRITHPTSQHTHETEYPILRNTHSYMLMTSNESRNSSSLSTTLEIFVAMIAAPAYEPMNPKGQSTIFWLKNSLERARTLRSFFSYVGFPLLVCNRIQNAQRQFSCRPEKAKQWSSSQAG